VKVFVQVHSSEPSAVLATETTLKMLPGGACQGFRRDASGEIMLVEGWVECETTNPSFLKFAVTNQGYAKRVSETGPA
jgi:hypothetical protein